MTKVLRSIILTASLLLAQSVLADEPIVATIETTLATTDQQIRQFALDGDGETFFAAEKVGPDDYFSLVLDKPVALKSLRISTGKRDGAGKLVTGSIEVSTDGQA